MSSRYWWRRAALGGLLSVGLAGCTSGVGRTSLVEPPVADDFQPLVVHSTPGAATRSAPIAARSANVGDAASVDAEAGRIRHEGVTSPPATIHLVGYSEPPPFPETTASSPAATPLVDALVQPVDAEVLDAAAVAEPVPLAPVVMDPAAAAAVVDNACTYPINLPTALALVAGQNPEVGFARWRVEESYARLDQAQVLWLPSIQAGINYHRHDGNLQNIEGRIVDINRSSLNAGLGAGATAAGTTTAPGLSARFHLADAIFQPQIAERTAWARGHAADAVLQDRLLDTAVAYLELLAAAQAIAIAEEEYNHTAQLAELTDAFAETGQGLQSDADRLQTELALRRNGVIRAQERFSVASARLAELVSLDTQHQLLPCEVMVMPIDLVSLACSRSELLQSGLSHRPELREARCLVSEACERLKREQYAPLVPSVLLGMSYGGFGGGVGGNVSRFNDRADFDAMAMWEVRNLGFGERAARQTAGSQIEQARYQQVRLMDRVAREIAESLAQAQSRQQQIAVAEGAIATARASYERNLARIQQGQGLPIEALQSIHALAAARREYLASVIDYNTAQFRLQRALGWPVCDATARSAEAG